MAANFMTWVASTELRRERVVLPRLRELPSLHLSGMAADAGLGAVRLGWAGHVLATWWCWPAEMRLPSMSERRQLTGWTLGYPRPRCLNGLNPGYARR